MLGEKVLKNKRRENVLSKGGQAVLRRYICHAAIFLTREIHLQQCKMTLVLEFCLFSQNPGVTMYASGRFCSYKLLYWIQKYVSLNLFN